MSSIRTNTRPRKTLGYATPADRKQVPLSLSIDVATGRAYGPRGITGPLSARHRCITNGTSIGCLFKKVFREILHPVARMSDLEGIRVVESWGVPEIRLGRQGAAES